MTPREAFNVATAIQNLALAAYPAEGDTCLPNDDIALAMSKIAGLAHTVKQMCLDVDPEIRKFRGG